MVVCLLAMAGPAASQPVVGVFTNAGGGGDCNLIEQLFVVQSVYVVYQSGVDAQSWRLRVSHNWTNATFIQPLYPILYINPPDVFGGDMFFGTGCMAAPYPFITLQFMPLSASTPCTVEIHVLPDPAAASGQIEVTDCSNTVLYAQSPAPYVSVNGDASCPCTLPVAAEPSTWGKVKSLYQ